MLPSDGQCVHSIAGPNLAIDAAAARPATVVARYNLASTPEPFNGDARHWPIQVCDNGAKRARVRLKLMPTPTGGGANEPVVTCP